MRRGFNSADWSMAFLCVSMITLIASMQQSTKLPTSEEVSNALRAEFNLSIDDTATADGVKKILQHLIKEANRAMGEDFHLMVEWQNLHQIPMATEQDVVDVMNDIQLSEDEILNKFKKMIDMSRREINISIDILNDDANWMTAAEAFAKKKLKENDGHKNVAVVINNFTLTESQAYLESVYEANPSWRSTTSGNFEQSRLAEQLAAAILAKVVLLLNTCKCQMKMEDECYLLADDAICPEVPACVQNWKCEMHSRNATKQHYLRFCKKGLQEEPPTRVTCPKAMCDQGCKNAQRSPVSKCNASCDKIGIECVRLDKRTSTKCCPEVNKIICRNCSVECEVRDEQSKSKLVIGIVVLLLALALCGGLAAFVFVYNKRRQAAQSTQQSKSSTSSKKALPIGPIAGKSTSNNAVAPPPVPPPPPVSASGSMKT